MLAATLAASALAACSEEPPPPPPEDPAVTLKFAPPAYDPDREPAAAVLPLVPQDAVTLTVTDLEQVRSQLGTDLTSASPPAERAAFWRRVAAETGALTRGLLRPLEGEPAAQGLTQEDVAWEATFSGAAGSDPGYVVGLREGVDLAAVERAIAAGAGPLAGAQLVAEHRLVVSGTVADSLESWAVLPGIPQLVGRQAVATYAERGCVEEGGTDDVDPLEAYAVELGSGLATVQLGPERRDVFDRLALGDRAPAFPAAFDGGVGDPATGRIGYRLADPAAAAALVQRRDLPVAACAVG